MRWPFAFVVHTLYVLYSTTADECLLTSPLEFQDQKDGDRKLVTLSGNQLSITPIGSADRLLPLHCVLLSVAMYCAGILLFSTRMRTNN